MLSRRSTYAVTLLVAICGAARYGSLQAQELDIELESTARLLPDAGTGLRAIHRDATGRYYVLAAPGSFLTVYSADGKLVGKIPSAGAKDSSFVLAEDFDVDSSGRVVVADRGANAIKIFDASWRLQNTFHATAPISVAAFSSGEIAVTSSQSRKLVDIYDASGKWLRHFGDLSSLAERPELNRSLNVGKLASDPSNNLYYAFTFLPEPTVRRYDRLGNSTLEISLVTTEFEPTAEAMRRQIWEQDQRPGTATLKPVVNAIGVDPQSLDIWVAIDDELTHFDREGGRRGETYRTFTADGDRMAPSSIIVEPNRLVLAADPIGVYAFPRPDKAPGIAPEKTEGKAAASQEKP